MGRATITHIGPQAGSDNTIYAAWIWSMNNTASYDIRWYYVTSDGVKFTGSDSNTTITDGPLQSTYNPPENATSVIFQVRPVSATHTLNETEVSYWTADWSTEATYSLSDSPPTKPPTPSVTLKELTLTATLNNLDVNGEFIQFEVVRDDTTVSHTGTVQITTTSVTYTCTVVAGSKYKVRCRAKRNAIYSEWSEYSENQSTIPDGGLEITQYYAETTTSVYLEWEASETAESYDIEYATELAYLGNSNASTIINNVENPKYIITGIEVGKHYYFRVRAVNDQGNSPWGPAVTLTLGLIPAAPTTWSSTTTAIVGEEVILYWVHNAGDGSIQRYTELELYVNGVKYIEDIKNPNVEDEENKICSYRLDTSEYEDGAEILWRMRTAGISMTYGDYSIQRTINVYAAPTLDLRMENNVGNIIEILNVFPFYIRGVAGPVTQLPIGYHVSIVALGAYETIDEVGNIKVVNKGDEVYSKYYDIRTDLLLEISANSVDLQNNIQYKIVCTATMNSGLSVEKSVYFVVAWSDDIYEPNAEIGYDKEAMVTYIKPYCKNELGENIQDITLSVYRREYDGRFVEIGTGIVNTDGIFITDPHPSLDYARYRIVAITNSTGAVSYYDLPAYPINEKAIVIQWNERWSNFDVPDGNMPAEPVWTGSLLRLPYNIDISDSNSNDVSLVEYIGRSHPVSYYGTHLSSTSTWNVEIDKKDKNTLYQLRRLATWLGDVYVREPSGTGYWASIAVSFSQTHCELTIPVTIEVTRVEGGM